MNTYCHHPVFLFLYRHHWYLFDSRRDSSRMCTHALVDKPSQRRIYDPIFNAALSHGEHNHVYTVQYIYTYIYTYVLGFVYIDLVKLW